jgi:hypothetical protein
VTRAGAQAKTLLQAYCSLFVPNLSKHLFKRNQWLTKNLDRLKTICNI